MGDNLRFRTIVVLLCTAFSLWLIGKPILVDHKPPLALGLDIRGGVNLRYVFHKDEKDKTPAAEVLATAKQIFQNRLDSLAVKEISITPVGDDQLDVAVPGITPGEADAIRATLESIGRLEFRLEAWTDTGVDVEDAKKKLEEEIKRRKDAGIEVTRSSDFAELTKDVKLENEGVTFRWVPLGEKYLHELAPGIGMDPTKLHWDTPRAWQLTRFDDRDGEYFTGEDVASVQSEPAPKTGLPAVGFVIKEGRKAQQFGDFTGKNIQKHLTILLDGQVQSNAVIHSKIPGNGVIEGGGDGFKPDELKRLISVIRSGSLPRKPELAQQYTQGPSLGEAAIKRALYALVTTFVIIAGFMVVYYRLAGFIADIALVCNLLLQAASMALLEATLTLPGVAGFILTIGMAVDANILITERIREEYDKGKTISQAVRNGFDRAWSTIFDSHITTFLAGFFLYRFGTGPIRGFAVTLMLGVATSLLTGVYFSRTIFGWLLERGLKTLTMLRLLTKPSYRFLHRMNWCYAASITLIVTGCTIFFLQDRSKYGMDFTGGYEAIATLREPQSQEEVRDKFSAVYSGADVVSIDPVGDKAKEFQIKIKQDQLEAAERPGAIDGVKPAATDASGSTAEVQRFGARVAAIFDGLLIEPPIKGLKLAPPDEGGRVEIDCGLHYPEPVRKADVEAALKKELSSIDSLEGPDAATDFTLKGKFARNPGGMDAARGRIASAAREMPAASGGGSVRMTEPLAQSYVGPRAGKDLRDSAIQAIFFTILAICIYVRIRFNQYRYGIAAVIALVHDVFITLAFIGFGRALGLTLEVDLTMVAAFLTIVGYSINDTIVVYDRVRENLPRSSLPLRELIELSVNQTLSRTILTSFTVFMSMVILFVFNFSQHNAIAGFAYAMIVGVVTGTYSSVWIASALVVNVTEWYEKRKNKAQGPPALAKV